MKDRNAMVEAIVRWAGPLPKDGYEILQRSTGKWHPVPSGDVEQFLHDGGIVYMNPRQYA